MCNKMTFSALKVTFRIVKVILSSLKVTFSGARVMNSNSFQKTIPFVSKKNFSFVSTSSSRVI
jgi:hypothetical protein